MTRPHRNDAFVADEAHSDAAQSVADQQAYIRRMVLYGTPTQAAEDWLRELERKLVRLRAVQQDSKLGE